MRVIKFRGKDSEWHYGNFDQDDCTIYRHGDGVYKVIPETVGQFTGVYDKDGREIYEDDIISFEAFGNPVELVHFEGSAFGIGGKNGLPKRRVSFFTILSNFVKYYDIYVIGNIHDNPELLEA